MEASVFTNNYYVIAYDKLNNKLGDINKISIKEFNDIRDEVCRELCQEYCLYTYQAEFIVNILISNIKDDVIATNVGYVLDSLIESEDSDEDIPKKYTRKKNKVKKNWQRNNFWER